MGSVDVSLTFSWVGALLTKALESGALHFTDLARYGQDIQPMWCVPGSSRQERVHTITHAAALRLTEYRLQARYMLFN